MTGDQDYAAALLFAIEPTDRALAGWGSNTDWPACYLRAAARWQERDDRLRAQAATACKTLTERSTP